MSLPALPLYLKRYLAATRNMDVSKNYIFVAAQTTFLQKRITFAEVFEYHGLTL